MTTPDTRPEAIQLIDIPESELSFVQLREDVFAARMPIAGCGWVRTDEGAVLIDTLLRKNAAARVLPKIHETAGRVVYIIYTHHHLDHIGGCEVFMADRPREVIGSRYVAFNLDKYRMLAPHRARVAAQQFHIKAVPPTGKGWVYPTREFGDSMTLACGGKTFELNNTRAETDDTVWVWIPEIRTAFLGDLVIRGFPNIGNPWKPTRFALEWAKALEAVRAKKPELIIGGGANVSYAGAEALEALDHNIAVIRSLHDQVVDAINADVHISEMIHQVRIPAELQDSPYLHCGYSRPEFFVYNVYRWYHGYFDHNPAHLLPRPRSEAAAVMRELVGDDVRIIDKAASLAADGQPQLALQVLDPLIESDPQHTAARSARRSILQQLIEGDGCVMSRNAYIHFLEADEAFLSRHAGAQERS